VRELPEAKTLAEAVRHVISSNVKDKYNPARFISKTQNGTAPDLLSACTELIRNPKTAELFEKALTKSPTLLSLEDFVARRGKGWGFDIDVIAVASARVAYFDSVVGAIRYR